MALPAAPAQQDRLPPAVGLPPPDAPPPQAGAPVLPAVRLGGTTTPHWKGRHCREQPSGPEVGGQVSPRKYQYLDAMHTNPFRKGAAPPLSPFYHLLPSPGRVQRLPPLPPPQCPPAQAAEAQGKRPQPGRRIGKGGRIVPVGSNASAVTLTLLPGRGKARLGPTAPPGSQVTRSHARPQPQEAAGALPHALQQPRQSPPRRTWCPAEEDPLSGGGPRLSRVRLHCLRRQQPRAPERRDRVALGVTE